MVQSSYSNVGDPFAEKTNRLDVLTCVSAASFWKPLHAMDSPWLAHAPFVFWLTGAARPEILMAPRLRDGFAFLCCCQAVRSLGLATACHAVDPSGGDDAGFAEALGRNYAGFATLHRSDRQENPTGIADGIVDLLLIDGEAGVATTQTCFRQWQSRLSSRAVLLLHGIHAAEDLRRLWAELASEYPAFEFTHGSGLGVLAVGSEIPADLSALFESAGEPRGLIHAAYARLGEAVAGQFIGDQSQLRLDDALKAELRLHAELKAVKVQNRRLREDWSAAQLAQQAALKRVEEIEQSTVWRASRKLRAALENSPSWRLRFQRGAEFLIWLGNPRGGIGGLRARLAFRSAAAPAQIAASRHLAFLPATRSGKDSVIADRNGRYALVSKPPGYVYVPPRRPEHLAEILEGLARRPFFSVIVPVYNTPPELLNRMRASVEAQWYPDWELILADDASPSVETRKALGKICDPRIKIKECAVNGGISAATNAAIAEAKGSHVVFLDHDDELTEDCLYELALCIAREDPDFIYSDEDKIDPEGQFTTPFFKPDWSPDTLMSTMYTAHVSCMRLEFLQEVGKLRPEFDGSQDWDLVLRVTERTTRIAHIPKVLYHWRMVASSTAAGLSAKPYAIDAAKRAREAALTRRGLDAVMEDLPDVPGYHRVRYAPRGTSLISIIIPSRDNGAVLQRCLDSLDRISSWERFEVLVIDNGSVKQDTLEILRNLDQRKNVRVLRHDVPFNWSSLNNLGARETVGELLLFLNDDTELLTPDGLERMTGYAQLPHIGAVGAKLLYPGMTQVQHAGVLSLANGPNHAFLKEKAYAHGYFLRNQLEYNWSAVTGACLMIERRKFLELGGFDENFPIAYNDIEICFRLLERGLLNVVCQAAQWLHYESLSRGSDVEDPKKYARLMVEMQNLYLRHPAMWCHDPFYNQNLSPHSLQFELPA